MASVSTPALTFEQFMELTKERRPWPELVDGEIVEQPMPHPLHGYIQARFGYLVMPTGLFPCADVHSRLGTNVRLPDVSIITTIPTRDYPTTPPLVAIEVLSPSNSHTELLKKCREYARWGVPHIWLVDPDAKQLSVFREDSFIAVDAFELPGYNLRITLADLLPPESPSPSPQ